MTFRQTSIDSLRSPTEYAAWRKRTARILSAAMIVVLSACGSEPPPPPPPVASDVTHAQPSTFAKPAPRPQSGLVVPEAQNESIKGFAHLAPSPAGAQAPANTIANGAAGDITLNFANADVREVVDSVLGRTLGLNYEIDPKVQSTVTLKTSQPLARAAVLQTLESVLAETGVAIVQNGDLYRVMPMSAAKANGAAPNVTGYGVDVIELKFASAVALKRILDPFVPTGGTLQVDTARNALVVSGSGTDRASFIRLVGTFDIDSMAGMSFAMFPIKQGDAVAMAHDLEVILHGQGQLGTDVRVVPIERVNSVLLIAAQPKAIDRASEWLLRLEQGPDEGSAQLYVYFVQNARATDLAKMLSQLFGSVSAGTGLSTAPGTTMAHTASSSNLALSGAPSQTGTGAPPAGSSPGPSGTSGSTPPQTDSDASAASGDDTQDAATPVSTQTKPAVHIVSDDKNNALVIRCRPADYRLIEAALKRLDIQSQQVLIEATVAEVTLNKNLSYGLQWYFQGGGSQVALSQGITSAITPAFPGFNWSFAGGNVQAILSALSSITTVNVVSSPQLMVLDHHTATLEVGDEVPIATQQATSVDTPGAPVVSSIQQEETGVILHVTPRVNNNGTTTLDIDQEVSQAVQTTTSNLNSPTISKRKITTEVAVADGQTIALGGMIQDQKTKGRSGLPGLSDLPYVGSLFGTTTDAQIRTELLILLTPRIIHDQAEAQDVTDELRERLGASNAQMPRHPSP
ncbi:MAG TPA: type II secretion system secretin GspD [Magnetospirillaceae bacterium]|jgi:general secretion pathway protein D